MAYLAFYRGTGITTAIIRWWTGATVAHVELGFENGTHFRVDVDFPANFIQPYNPPDVIVQVPMTPEQEEKMRLWCEGVVGAKYDVRGILLSQIFNRCREHPSFWVCSELCVAALQQVDSLPKWLIPIQISPGQLMKMATLIWPKPV